ncbi:MAG TPA: hypothetical protein VK826_13260 [Bacteroidia bacterium]|nr:hypothetical protein [Bacteroidia bacterium]
MKNILKISALVLAVFFPWTEACSCSSYKITAHGKTMVGSNYDSWYVNPVIWFETNGYGAAFSGARREGENAIAPQTGLNEYGLAFVTLSAPPVQGGFSASEKKQITSRSEYLKSILHSCRTVEEVKTYIDQYDHSTLFNEVILYTDSSGHYLVVEPYVLTLGGEPSYVLANFCPSTITNFSEIKQARYVNGAAFARNKLDSSLAFCTAMSDTMHVCREKIGDGTLLTSILDLQRGIIHLYFYHDYNHHAQVNLRDELAKGEHRIEIASLFPVNEEYEKFLAFKTPGKSDTFNVFMYSCAGLFFLSGFIFGVSFFRSRGQKYRFVKLLIVPLCWIMCFYMLVLLRNEGIFYFPAPYQDYTFSILNVAAYIPFLMLLLIAPIVRVNVKVFKQGTWNSFSTYLLTINTVIYVVFIGLFAYWGLYNVFH